jgi:hypothetical protein
MGPEPVIARRINRETVVLLGWGRAILMQLAHPLVAAAVRDYSRFDQSAGGYVRRVRRTVGGMLAITFGSAAAAQESLARINGIHHQVRGTLRDAVGVFPAGTPYSATDPDLLNWVHATIVDSMIVTYELLVAPLSEAECDQFCRGGRDGRSTRFLRSAPEARGRPSAVPAGKVQRWRDCGWRGRARPRGRAVLAAARSRGPPVPDHQAVHDWPVARPTSGRLRACVG